MIGMGNSAPTPAQSNAVTELTAIYRTEARAHNELVSKTLPAWSEELRKLGLLGLTAMQPIQALP